MEKKLKILAPGMPNFVSFEQPAGQRQDGMGKGLTIDIAYFSQQEAEEYAEFMRKTFLEHYKDRKSKQDNKHG